MYFCMKQKQSTHSNRQKNKYILIPQNKAENRC